MQVHKDFQNKYMFSGPLYGTPIKSLKKYHVKGGKKIRNKVSYVNKKVNRLSRIVRTPKYWTFDFSQQVGLNAGPGVLRELLTTIPHGNHKFQREDMVVYLKSINLFYTVAQDKDAGPPIVPKDDPTNLRIMLILDKRVNQTGIPAMSDLLDDPNDWRSPIKLDSTGRFKILYTEVFDLTKNCPIRTVRKYKKLRKPIRIDYNSDTASAIANHERNALYWYAISNTNANSPYCYVTCRLGFYDA